MTSPRNSNDAVRTTSYGRGGAGNIGKDTNLAHPSPNDLVTPTLKANHYTTGRGGTGNMARNDPAHPELARASQDVDAPVHREPEGPHHYGRGGAANIAKPSEDEVKVNKETNRRKSSDAAERQGPAGDVKGLMDKGKEFLGKLGKK